MPDKVEQHFPQRVSVCRDCGDISTPGVVGGKCQVLPTVFKDHDRVVIEVAPVQAIRKQRDRELHRRLTGLGIGTAPDRDERYQMAWRDGIDAARRAIMEDSDA